MSLSHSSFSCVRVSAWGSGHSTSTSQPRWLPAGRRAQRAQGTLQSQVSPQTPAFGLLQQPEIIPAPLLPIQLGLKHSLNYSTRGRKSHGPDTKALAQPVHPDPTVPSWGGYCPDTGMTAGAKHTDTLWTHSSAEALFCSSNWTNTGFSFRNILPLTGRIKCSTENLS